MACTEALERYQEEIVEQEDVKWDKVKKKYMDELRPEFDDLDKHEREIQSKNGDRDLLVWLYKTLDNVFILYKIVKTCYFLLFKH